MHPYLRKATIRIMWVKQQRSNNVKDDPPAFVNAGNMLFITGEALTGGCL
jgi:hypothetical protein